MTPIAFAYLLAFAVLAFAIGALWYINSRPVGHRGHPPRPRPSPPERPQ